MSMVYLTLANDKNSVVFRM